MMRRAALIGVIVGIFGIPAALAVGYPAGAKVARSHHTRCAPESSKSTAKSAKRRRKCRKRKPASSPRRTPEPTGSGTLHIVDAVPELGELNFTLGCNPTSGRCSLLPRLVRKSRGI